MRSVDVTVRRTYGEDPDPGEHSRTWKDLFVSKILER